jgi:predicted N-acetyltransferase YhbS
MDLKYSYRKFQDGDEVALEELLRNTFPRFNENNLWLWKYKLNPYFKSSIVILAEKDGEIIGCNYWMLRDFKLLNNLPVKIALAADVAVNPKYRGYGIGTELIRYPRSSGAFKEKGILLTYMFGRPELSKKFYQPAAGYIVAPNSTITYTKHFNCNQLKDKFQKIEQAIKSNETARRELRELSMVLSFKLKGVPEFAVHIEPEKVYLKEGKADVSDVIIEGSLPLSSLLIRGSIGFGYLVKAWLTGKIKVKKGLLLVFKMRKVFKLFQTTSNQTSKHNITV